MIKISIYFGLWLVKHSPLYVCKHGETNNREESRVLEEGKPIHSALESGVKKYVAHKHWTDYWEIFRALRHGVVSYIWNDLWEYDKRLVILDL